jgi:RecA-family ATPase
MSDHKKPSEVIRLVPGGEIVTELNPIEELSEKWRADTYRGNQILDLPPQRWSVPGWLPSDSLVALYAAPGVGKSFYALSLAIEAARGGEWLGQNLEPHPV